MRHLPEPLLALLLVAAGCGGGGGGSPTLDLPPAQWTWVNVPGTACSDGSGTGIAVNPAPASSTDSIVLVYLEGGGACWPGSFDCRNDQFSPATPGPFGQAQFRDLEPHLPGTILDRSIAGTPFAGATLVFVPYCTGDVHWGASTVTYPGNVVWHHAGKNNLVKDVAWLKDHLSQPGKLVVAGSSAGGYGSLLAFDLARTAWPGPAAPGGSGTAGYLVDDAGPPLVDGDIQPAELEAWYSAWNLSATVGPLCGTGCQTDVSKVVGALRAKYPNDRFALLSNLQDSTISFFLGYSSGSSFQAALLRLVDQSFSTTTEGAHAFLLPGTTHTLLAPVNPTQADGTDVVSWLRQMVDDEAGWTTLGHPSP